ncbi:predicted signal transduction histidine kinase [Methanothermobacter marburgensis str. Marburg]|uniref:histidine kinase n=3 Tax=Methanobacteriaceae TaxID=2159 RepID=D9PXY8_METTM|nr:predicted signal transduction histidine kinase [Methanothermobacter marburgensis str. Marburg]
MTGLLLLFPTGLLLLPHFTDVPVSELTFSQKLLGPLKITVYMDPERDALRIALYYAIFSLLWILSSDHILYLIAKPPLLVQLSIIKGSLFILLTSLFLFAVLRLYLRSLSDKEKSLRISERKFRSLFMELPVGVVLMDADGKILESNPTILEIFRQPADNRFIGELHKDLAAFRKSQEFMIRQGGGWIRVLIRRIDGYFLGIFEDITDIKRSEETARRSLEANRTLLSELHHRVKNNLQIISSLINLQARGMDQDFCELMRALQLRIRAMALVHELLLSNPEASTVDFASYTERLLSYLRDMHSSGVQIEVDIVDVKFDIETAVPLGLILNELVSNSLRHAFDDGGTIRVSLEDTGNAFLLRVSDNGRGLPEGFSLKENAGLGLDLVGGLVRQLDGTLTFESAGGTSFMIEFREPRYPRRV